MKRMLTTLVLLSMSLGIAAPRVQTVTMNIEQKDNHLVLEVYTEEQHWNEMSFYIYRPGHRNFERRIVPPRQPGVYQLEYTFSDYGFWEINLRSGMGLDRYYGKMTLESTPGSKTFTRRSIFHGDLDLATPRYIQTIGFVIFGILLVLTFILIGSILRWISYRHRTT